MLESWFRLREHGSDVRTECLAGLSTFLAMAYIVFVNPDILAAAGMPRDAVFVATCLAAARQVATNTASRGIPAAARMSGLTKTM